tara:strand:+ start:183 stop:368 length:186 start_codon:yes stop_codon:yes gene_type:complete
MSRIYYKKPNGEIFEFVAGRVQKSSCDKKYIMCDADGKEIKAAPKKEVKKAKKEPEVKNGK